MWIFPSYRIKVDPNPVKIPTIEELDLEIPNSTGLNASQRGFLQLLLPADSFIKNTANKISVIACPNVEKQIKVCYAKALFYFVRDNVQYVNDPFAREYLASPAETLASKAGDCDDHSILLANLLEAIGLETRYVFTNNHVFVQVKLEEALKGYKTDDDWVSLDATCKDCRFGELPWQVQKSRKNYL